jgi:hypothetical protein
VSSLVFLLLAAAAALGLYRTLRSRAENVRYLEEAGDESPLAVSHLSRPLQQLAHETRALRLSLEHPLRQLGTAPRSAAEVDLRMIQQGLTNASREIGDWLRTVERLGDEDRARLSDFGAKPAIVRELFGAEGGSLELDGPRAGAIRRIGGRIREIQRELERIERALQTRTDPYR